MELHLSKIYINLLPSRTSIANPIDYEVGLLFNRLSDDKKTAYFVSDKSHSDTIEVGPGAWKLPEDAPMMVSERRIMVYDRDSYDPYTYTQAWDRVRLFFRKGLVDPRNPPYMIRINHLTNDTELPDLVIDELKDEISFNWKKMLTLFFREKNYLRTCRDDWWNNVGGLALTHGPVMTITRPFSDDELTRYDSVASHELHWRRKVRHLRLKDGFYRLKQPYFAYLVNTLALEDSRAIIGIPRQYTHHSEELKMIRWLGDWCLHRIEAMACQASLLHNDEEGDEQWVFGKKVLRVKESINGPN